MARLKDKVWLITGGIWKTVVAAADAAVYAARPGAPWSGADAAARRVMGDAGFADAFPHITGHGVGFAYHEPVPLIGPDLAGEVRVGQVVAIEPGIYLPEAGGFRFEDNYVITESGARSITPAYRELE